MSTISVHVRINPELLAKAIEAQQTLGLPVSSLADVVKTNLAISVACTLGESYAIIGKPSPVALETLQGLTTQKLRSPNTSHLSKVIHARNPKISEDQGMLAPSHPERTHSNESSHISVDLQRLERLPATDREPGTRILQAIATHPDLLEANLSESASPEIRRITSVMFPPQENSDSQG